MYMEKLLTDASGIHYYVKQSLRGSRCVFTDLSAWAGYSVRLYIKGGTEICGEIKETRPGYILFQSSLWTYPVKIFYKDILDICLFPNYKKVSANSNSVDSGLICRDSILGANVILDILTSWDSICCRVEKWDFDQRVVTVSVPFLSRDNGNVKLPFERVHGITLMSSLLMPHSRVICELMKAKDEIREMPRKEDVLISGYDPVTGIYIGARDSGNFTTEYYLVCNIDGKNYSPCFVTVNDADDKNLDDLLKVWDGLVASLGFSSDMYVRKD